MLHLKWKVSLSHFLVIVWYNLLFLANQDGSYFKSIDSLYQILNNLFQNPLMLSAFKPQFVEDFSLLSRSFRQLNTGRNTDRDKYIFEICTFFANSNESPIRDALWVVVMFFFLYLKYICFSFFLKSFIRSPHKIQSSHFCQQINQKKNVE